MTACTDDERREVARRLRELPGDSTYPDLIGVIADHDGWYPAADAADRLADLIDPDIYPDYPDKIRQDLSEPCDRDALLALEDEMYGRLDEYDVGLHGGIYMANEMRKYARRIREALGVGDD